MPNARSGTKPRTQQRGAFPMPGTEIALSSLAAALAAQKPSRMGGRCGVDILLETLDDIDRQALINAIKSPMPATVIGRAIEAERKTGQPEVAGQTIARHRRGDCTCKRGEA